LLSVKARCHSSDLTAVPGIQIATHEPAPLGRPAAPLNRGALELSEERGKAAGAGRYQLPLLQRLLAEPVQVRDSVPSPWRDTVKVSPLVLVAVSV
jgi:hypothetical protein